MRSIKPLLIFLLAACAFAAGSVQSQLLEAARPLGISQNFSYAQIELNGSSYYILFSSQNPSAVFLQQGQQLSLLSKQAQMLPVLLSYYGKEGAQQAAAASLLQAHSAILQFQAAAGGQGVADCKRITGTDTHPCDTYENCRLACYSVTSYCYPIALGSGKSFIDAIWKFTNNTRDLNSAIAKEQAAYNGALLASNAQTLGAYILAFNSASKIANELENSALVNWICPSQGFDMVGMSKAGDSLARALLSLEAYEALQAHSAAMERFAGGIGAAPALFALEPLARGTSTCPIRVEHFITSGNITSLATIKLETTGGCNLSSFALRERIPEDFSPSVEKGRFSIPPISLEAREAYWEFDSLQDGQVLVLTYSTDGWVGYSRVKHFNSTKVALLSQKPLLQNHGLLLLDSSVIPTNNTGTKTAANEIQGSSSASATGANAKNVASANDANMQAGSNAADGSQKGAGINSAGANAEKNAIAGAGGKNGYAFIMPVVAAVALAALAYAFLLRKKEKAQ